ncbi:uncharacterized protein H6S33_004438 [Morchella sextelata]|uniref:uncharacterized protein n=1 Tax=Morchella sextelata TaxID=1174677 RepID=UPI001D05584A|nr:uncharacterized protein H6S33_004438 [Morchella sextelata]KAH0605981.1 hypothetical protein H6S33_004438 [Morchella sextelata]
MAAHNKQFTLYSVTAGPNPWKVNIILEELNLPYHTVYIDRHSGEHKKAPYLAVNPNGRMPALVDHSNNDFTVWESGAIILYLVKKYDTAHAISFPDFESDMLATQWLMFQMSGQGPYFGQYVHFAHSQAEKIPSAIARYRAEIDRVLGVLEGVLAGKEYLVGDKCSYADLAFVPWYWALDYFAELRGWGEGFPAVAAWLGRIAERVPVVTARETREGVMGRRK